MGKFKIYFIALLLFNYFDFTKVFSQQIAFEQNYGGINDQSAWSVLQTSDGGYILGGTNENVISKDKLIIK